jgi:hypothetical protein
METIESYRADNTILEWSSGNSTQRSFWAQPRCLLLGRNTRFGEAREVRVGEHGHGHAYSGSSRERTQDFLFGQTESNDVEIHTGAGSESTNSKKLGFRDTARRRLASVSTGL